MTKLLASLRSAFVMDELPAWASGPALVIQHDSERVQRGLPSPRQDPRCNDEVKTRSERQGC